MKKKDIPNKIKIGNFEYDIEFAELEDDYGHHVFDINQSKIILANDLKNNSVLLENVLFHEIIHSILYQIGCEESSNELLTQGLTNEIQKLFKLRKL